MTLEKDALPTAPAAPFETGTARWVALPARSRLRQNFVLPVAAERARLHLTGQGLVRAELNGSAVNGDRLDPTRTDSTRALYRSYDVAEHLVPGVNALDFVVAAGEWSRTGLDPRLLAELVIDHVDGTQTRITPDETAMVAPSRIAVEDPFYLERHDPAAELQGSWSALPSSAFLEADDAGGVVAPPAEVEEDPTPKLGVVSRIPLVEIGRPDGGRLYDAGTNIAGRSRIVVAGRLAAGAVVEVVHGEHIGADGHIDTTNLTMPFDHGRVRQVVEWVATGDPGDVIEPWFAYHGFRYVEVRGLAEDAEVEASAGILHTDIAPVGRVKTDNSLIGTLLERAERTFLNNQHGVPEDCPTREQSAWTGDTASVAEYAFGAFDVEAYFAKWIGDLLTSQAADGSLPAIAPDVRDTRMPADPVWGAALHRLVLGHWRHYGDIAVVLDALPALRRWAAFQLSCEDEGGVISRSPISYGHDWLALEQTPPEVHHTSATIDCLTTLALLEAEVGDAASALTWRAHADRLRAGAKARFFDPERGVFANGSQGAYAAAIDAGILTGAEAEAAAARIERDVRERGNRISGGFATTRTIVRALAATGRSQVIVDMLAQPAEPGIGAMLVHGPGTFWECWWIDPNNTGTGSLDHIGLGGVFAGWAWQTLAGVQATGVGFDSVRIAPQFVTGVDALEMSRVTRYGELRVGYEITGGTANVRVEIPRGVSAVFEVAGIEPVRFGPGIHELAVPAIRGESAAARVEEPWRAPSIAPVAADVTGPRDLLEIALASGGLSAGEGTVLREQPGLNCMPIPHAQPAGAVVEVVADAAGSTPSVRVELSEPLDAGGCAFLYALIDLCDDRWDSTARPVLRLHAADGSAHSVVGTSWPAGWNRVAIDIDGWPGRTQITEIEVSVCSSGDADHIMPQGAESSPAGFHIGEIGLSRARRTW